MLLLLLQGTAANQGLARTSWTDLPTLKRISNKARNFFQVEHDDPAHLKALAAEMHKHVLQRARPQERPTGDEDPPV